MIKIIALLKPTGSWCEPLTCDVSHPRLNQAVEHVGHLLATQGLKLKHLLLRHLPEGWLNGGGSWVPPSPDGIWFPKNLTGQAIWESGLIGKDLDKSGNQNCTETKAE